MLDCSIKYNYKIETETERGQHKKPRIGGATALDVLQPMFSKETVHIDELHTRLV